MVIRFDLACWNIFIRADYGKASMIDIGTVSMREDPMSEINDDIIIKGIAQVDRFVETNNDVVIRATMQIEPKRETRI